MFEPTEKDKIKHIFHVWGISVFFLLLLLLQGCANTETADEAVENVVETKAWYCGPGLMGIRAVARFIISAATGTAIPDVCKAVDAIIIEGK